MVLIVVLTLTHGQNRVRGLRSGPSYACIDYRVRFTSAAAAVMLPIQRVPVTAEVQSGYTWYKYVGWLGSGWQRARVSGFRLATSQGVELFLFCVLWAQGLLKAEGNLLTVHQAVYCCTFAAVRSCCAVWTFTSDTCPRLSPW